jgi:hypothetical protein
VTRDKAIAAAAGTTATGVTGVTTLASGHETGAVTIKIVRGGPTAEELAALIAVLSTQAAAGGAEPAARPRQPSGWTDLAARVHAPRIPGPGGWRVSAFPR